MLGAAAFAEIVDVEPDSIIIEATGNENNIDSLVNLQRDYEIIELVRTGPYRLVSWQRQQQLVMEAFDRHWRGVHKPARIAIRGVREAGTRLAELQTGRADLVPLPGSREVTAYPRQMPMCGSARRA